MASMNCCVPGCHDKVSSKHRFPNPRKNIDRFKIWINAIGNPTLLSNDPVEVYDNKRVCRRHFEDQYSSIGNKRLHWNAIPTLLLPSPAVGKIHSDSRLTECRAKMSAAIKYEETEINNSDTSIFCKDTKIGLTDIITTCERTKMSRADTEMDVTDSKPQILNTTTANEQFNLDGSNANLNIKPEPFEFENRVKQELDVSYQETGLMEGAIKNEKIEMSCSDTIFFEEAKIWNMNNTKGQSDFGASNANTIVKCDPLATEIYVKQELDDSNQGTGLTDGAIKKEKIEMSCSDTILFEEAKIWNMNNSKEQFDFNASHTNTSVKCDPLATETYVKQENDVYVDPSFSTFSDDNRDTDDNTGDDRSMSVDEMQSQLKCKDKTPFRCDVCNRTFTRRAGLKNHKRTHTGEKPYQCGICNKRFRRSIYLSAHKRMHTGEKPYQCNICNKTFRRINERSVHKRIHTGVKPYQCDICNKTFVRKHHLSNHKRTHAGEKSYKYDICIDVL